MQYLPPKKVGSIPIDQKPMSSYYQVIISQNRQLTIRLELENDDFLGKSFRWNPNHPLVNCKVKSTMRVEVEQNEPTQLEEEEGKKYFRPSYTEVKEHNREINEEKPPKWMEVDIKTK